MKNIIITIFLFYMFGDLRAQTVYMMYDAFGNRLTKSLIGTNPNPVITGTPTSVCKGQNVQLNATGGTTYIWSNGKTGSTVSFIADSTRTYLVTAYNTTGCSAIAYYEVTVNNCSVFSRVASNDLSQSLTAVDEKENADWNLYPNPAINGTNVNLRGDQIDKVVVSVYDDLGRKLANRTVIGKTVNIVPLEKSIFPTSGIYLIQVTYNKKTATKKLLVTY